jgi:hypothetical protein
MFFMNTKAKRQMRHSHSDFPRHATHAARPGGRSCGLFVFVCLNKKINKGSGLYVPLALERWCFRLRGVVFKARVRLRRATGRAAVLSFEEKPRG